jgi:hypothetical protein
MRLRLEEESLKNISDSDVRAIAIGLNTLLALEMRRAGENNDEDGYSACLASMVHIVRIFMGEEEAEKMVNVYTNGAMSELDRADLLVPAKEETDEQD